MQSTLIRIGNSRGVRLSKEYLIRSGIDNDIDIIVKKGEIKIRPAKKPTAISSFGTSSEASFAKDWLRPEEEEAWKIYQ